MAYLHWTDFLDADMISLLRSTAIDQEQRFVEATVTSGDSRKVRSDFRRSKLLWHCREIYDPFVRHLRTFLPDLSRAFPQLPSHPTFEMQVTAHGDGEYFKRHIDNGCPQTSRRIATYVYYFTLDDEQKFTGGELILETDQGPFTIAPNHNTIILFPSGWWHEVKPVSVSSRRWEDARFTVNGWMY